MERMEKSEDKSGLSQSITKLQDKLKIYAGLRNNLELQAQEVN